MENTQKFHISNFTSVLPADVFFKAALSFYGGIDLRATSYFLQTWKNSYEQMPKRKS